MSEPERRNTTIPDPTTPETATPDTATPETAAPETAIPDEPGSGPGVTSQRKIESNRRNAGRSTGPRTQHGKSYSRLNALKHGILASVAVNYTIEGTVERGLFEQMVDGLGKEFNPLGWREELLVQEIAGCYWSKRKLSQYEQDLAFERYHGLVEEEQGVERLNSRIPEVPPLEVAYAFRDPTEKQFDMGSGIEARKKAGLQLPTLPNPADLAIITRYESMLDRRRERLTKELERLQAARLAASALEEAPEAASGGIDPGTAERNSRRNCVPLPIELIAEMRDEKVEEFIRENKPADKGAAGAGHDAGPNGEPAGNSDAQNRENYQTKPKNPGQSDISAEAIHELSGLNDALRGLIGAHKRRRRPPSSG